MTTLRRQLIVVVGLLISAGALYLVLASIDIGEALAIISRANPFALLGIVAVVAVQVTLRAFRWSLLFPRRPEGTRSPATRLLPPLLIGYLGNAVLPARLGEPMRALIASRRERAGLTEAMGSVLVERLIDVATLAVVAFTATLIVDAPSWTRQALGVAAALGITGIVVLSTLGISPLLKVADRLGLERRVKLSSLARRFADSVGGPSRRPAIIGSAGISVAAWLLDALSFWLAAQAVGVELSYAGAMLVAGITVLGTAIPSAPGYVGTFELAAAGMAGALGVAPAPALAMAVVAHVMTLMPMALGGAVALTVAGTSLGDAARDAGTARAT
jgi:glycosyltransferase 2 family protein